MSFGLARTCSSHIARDVFCVGSNYVWTWETNRVMREIVTTGAGGPYLAERLLELGETAVGHMVQRDRRTQARRSVFNTLDSRKIELPFHSRLHAAIGEARVSAIRCPEL